MTKKPDSALSESAAKLEQELGHFDELLSELSRPLNSEKTLQRARQVLEECSACEGRLAEHLRAFAQAMQSFQQRQQGCMEALNEKAQHLQTRHDDRSALLERVAALGQRAREIAAPLASLSDESWSTAGNDVLASVREVSTRLDEVVDEAAAVAVSAKEAGWIDILRDADTLKQQLQAAKNRIAIGQRKLASRAPS